MRWTITNNNGVLYPTTIIVNGNGIDDMERNVAFELGKRGWKRENVVIKNSQLIYRVVCRDGFLELDFLIEGQDVNECQKKLDSILNKLGITNRNIKVQKIV